MKDVAVTGATFAITDAKWYVHVVTLSSECNTKEKEGLIRKMVTNDQHLDHLIDPSF